MATGEAPRRSQEQRRSASEEALLSAASQLIAERGVERASLAGIGQLAGASRGLPTHHFGSKEALLARVAERAQDRGTTATVAAYERTRRKSRSLSALGSLSVLVDTYLGRLEDPSPEARALIVLWGATFPSKVSMDVMTQADERAYDGLAGLIRQGQEEGSIRPDVDPTGAAALVLGLIRGLGALFLTKPASVDLTRARRTCQAAITAALAAPPDGNGSRGGAARKRQRIER